MKRTACVFVATAVLAGCARAPKAKAPQPAPPGHGLPSGAAALLPLPARLEPGRGAEFRITGKTVLHAGDPALAGSAAALREWIRRATGIAPAPASPVAGPPENAIELSLDPARTALGPEGYDLVIDAKRVLLTAAAPAGVFYGVQTLRQLLPYWAEHEAVLFAEPRPATLPPLHIEDTPRFAWRGAMLDVARHFFTVDDVKRFVDLLALHKMNRLHLHLADDQGWRIEIAKWPDLTAKGGLGEVGGTPGGFYTKAQYADIVAYAAARFVTIVPEIDMPGHTNAALASYAQLNCSGQAPPPYSGTEVGFSALCVDNPATYQFIDDIVGEIAAMTPGPYFHCGGDEVKTLTPAQYRTFIERVQTIVQAHGKQMIGWDEIAGATLLPSSIVQHWRPEAPKDTLARAAHLVLSPADRSYLDMKYHSDIAIGLTWAGLIPVKTAYDWDPGTLVPGAAPGSVLGVEAALWAETLANIRDLEFLAMPRLAAIAEVGWSPASLHSWEPFRLRLAAQAPRWTALGINFYRAPDIPWKSF